jgi:hypothetical protein
VIDWDTVFVVGLHHFGFPEGSSDPVNQTAYYTRESSRHKSRTKRRIRKWFGRVPHGAGTAERAKLDRAEINVMRLPPGNVRRVTQVALMRPVPKFLRPVRLPKQQSRAQRRFLTCEKGLATAGLQIHAGHPSDFFKASLV